eukprot:1992295-Amphidinium_carterae.3
MDALKADIANRGSISFNAKSHPGLAARLGTPVAGYTQCHDVMDSAVPDATGALDGFLASMLEGRMHDFS